MPSDAVSPPESKAMLWTGRLMSVVPGLLLLLDGVMKVIRPEPVVKATTEMGYPENIILPLGVVLCISAILYLIPRTAVLGAILLTGYLGGAVDAHVHAGEGVVPILFPVTFGVLVWGGLFLRDAHLRAIFPWRS